MAEYLMLWTIYLFIVMSRFGSSEGLLSAISIFLIICFPPISLILFVSRRRKEAKAKKAEKSKETELDESEN